MSDNHSPTEADFGKALQAHLAGDLARAKVCYQTVLNKQANHAPSLTNLGLILQSEGDLTAAKNLYGKALEAVPNYAEAHVNLALLLQYEGKISEAISHLTAAIHARPDLAAAHNNLALLLHVSGEAESAEAHFKNAIELNPKLLDAHNGLGNLYLAQNKLEEARHCFLQALSLEPRFIKSLNGLANVSRAEHDYIKALEVSEQVCQAEPNYIEAWINLGLVQQDLGDYSKAAVSFNKALALRPDDQDALYSLALLELGQGDFAKGWAHYETRFTKRDAFGRFALPGIPEANGAPLENKHIYLYGEQGVGDEIMFASMFSDLILLPGDFTIGCDARLLPLFRRSFPHLTFTDADSPELATPVDLQMPMGSLASYCRRTAEEFPNVPFYLKPCRERRQHWQTVLSELSDKPKVGISWFGGMSPFIQERRSIPAASLQSKLSALPIDCINLQHGEHREDLSVGLLDLDPRHNLVDLIALISCLDVVVTIDNSTAHIAAALGKPVLLLLSTTPEWRWQFEGESSVWYPTVKLFRQTRFGQWEPALEAAKLALKKLL